MPIVAPKNRLPALGIALVAALVFAPPALAQSMKQKFTIRNGQMVQGAGAAGNTAGGGLQISEEQKMMFDALGYLMKRDFKNAETLYSHVLAMDPGNIEAYLQRGLARREMGDAQGAGADGRSAVIQANAFLQRDPRDADLYYKRSMGYRLLRQFDYARRDMEVAIRLSGKKGWQTDLQAIALEQKMAQAAR